MSHLFKKHSIKTEVLKHKSLPLYKTKEFSFFRCVKVGDWTYNTIISDLHKGNLRENNNPDHRYSKLFPEKKISYWANSKETALAEIKKHGGNKDYLTFWAYDDVSSTFPVLGIDEELIIIDGMELGFESILKKIEEGSDLTNEEKDVIKQIDLENPDCLAYKSHAIRGGVNFLFFEKGFQKLALREVTLYLGENKSKNRSVVHCAVSSDYEPCLEHYGYFFKPIARKCMSQEYIKSDEYLKRKANESISYKIVSDFYSSNRDEVY